ncbi:HIRAN domain-containing protein [Breznakibacter xylanolyticus]|uniref:HIRAN domain-containing protein n=1 Tax=Breznakibacter xylanolyticus TaxID=990 RepID=A0A2W7MUI0_9BACT|nr:HIRAN domain-containing protein [Breznakibacter xylanolyticus]PZX11795.1 HIRAN domain-containing protein [Breznakibacter xylanolyticus]
MKRRHFTHFNISGFSYYEGPIVFNDLKIGTELRLVYEPDNKYDPKAVAIYFGDEKLGFVPRSDNNEISKLLEMGHDVFETRVQRIDATQHPENQVGVIVYVKKNDIQSEV